MHAPRCPLKQVNPVTASVRLRNSQSLSACDSLVSVSTVCGYTVTPRSGNHVSPCSWLLSKERHFLLVQRLSDPAAYLYLQFEQPLSLCGAGLESVLPPPCLARAPWTAPRTGAPARSCAVQLLLGWAVVLDSFSAAGGCCPCTPHPVPRWKGFLGLGAWALLPIPCWTCPPLRPYSGTEVMKPQRLTLWVNGSLQLTRGIV